MGNSQSNPYNANRKPVNSVSSNYISFKLSHDTIILSEKFKSIFGKGRKNCGKRRKCWLPAFSPFLSMFSKGFISLKVVKDYKS